MNPNDTIRLLILNDSRDEAERLTSMLRNAGRPTRAQHVENEEGLAKLLQEKIWDLLICPDNTTSVVPVNAVRQIQRLSKDVPVILLSDREGTQPKVEALKLGAADSVQLDEDQHLLLVIQRELENRDQRQLRRRADRRFKETERRGQQLLDSSRDAIAYVQDGMYLYANDSFAERFGYDDREDIECMPVIDMIEDADQDKVKRFLKEFTLHGDDANAASLDFNGSHQEGHSTPISVEVANAIYDEESCIQFMIRASAGNSEELEAQLDQIKNQDAVTGLHNRQYMIDTLETVVGEAANNEQTSALLYIEIDNFFTQIQPNLGMAGSDAMLCDMAELLGSTTGDADTLARFADETFAILARGTNADAALARAEALCRTVEDHIVDIEGKTVQATISIGIALVNETSTDADTAIEHARQAIATVREASDIAGVGNSAKLYEPPHVDSEGGEQDIAKQLKHALKNNGFRLLFQPIISLRGSSEEHYEVLVRMTGDKGEEIAPLDYHDAATQLGVLGKIDRWVVLEATKALSEQRAKGHNTKLMINLSAASLCDETLLPWLNVAFKAADLPSDALLFQVNETDITNHLNAAKALAEGVQKMKSKLCISNFGCSLNPFNALKHIAADSIKVDGSFTMHIQNNDESPETLTQLLDQLHEQEKTTVVPFVDNASVLSTLWQAGAHYIQGPYLQGPTPTMDYEFNMEE